MWFRVALGGGLVYVSLGFLLLELGLIQWFGVGGGLDCSRQEPPGRDHWGGEHVARYLFLYNIAHRKP